LFGLSDVFEKDYISEPEYNNQTNQLVYDEQYLYSQLSEDSQTIRVINMAIKYELSLKTKVRMVLKRVCKSKYFMFEECSTIMVTINLDYTTQDIQ